MNDIEEYNLKFCRNYLTHMLDVMGHLPEQLKKDTLRQCSKYHYDENNMDELLADYVGNIEGFVTFLTEQWGWIISYDKTNGIIIADENKPNCVCPIVAEGDKMSSNLCFCSEGFAARMFSKITGHEVKTRIVASILRGDTHCVYEIQL